MLLSIPGKSMTFRTKSWSPPPNSLSACFPVFPLAPLKVSVERASPIFIWENGIEGEERGLSPLLFFSDFYMLIFHLQRCFSKCFLPPLTSSSSSRKNVGTSFFISAATFGESERERERERRKCPPLLRNYSKTRLMGTGASWRNFLNYTSFSLS